MTIPHRTTWHFWIFLLVAIPVALFSLNHFSPYRAWYGAWDAYQQFASLIIIGLVALRFVGAWIFKEQNSGWKYYLIVLIASPFLVQSIFALARLAFPKELEGYP
jgi:hypothetical protein